MTKTTQSCHYDSENKKVACQDKVKKKTYLTMKDINKQCEIVDVCGYDKTSLSYRKSIKESLSSTFKDLGYFMRDKEKEKLEESIKIIENRMAQEVKTTTR